MPQADKPARGREPADELADALAFLERTRYADDHRAGRAVCDAEGAIRRALAMLRPDPAEDDAVAKFAHDCIGPAGAIRVWRVLRSDGRELRTFDGPVQAVAWAQSRDRWNPDDGPHHVERWDGETAAWVPERSER